MIWVLMRCMVSLRFDRRGSELIWIYMAPVKVWKSHYFSCTNVRIMQYIPYMLIAKHSNRYFLKNRGIAGRCS